MWIESQPGSGTKVHFTARFTLAKKAESDTTTSNEEAAQNEESALVLDAIRGMRVLAVDDSEVRPTTHTYGAFVRHTYNSLDSGDAHFFRRRAQRSRVPGRMYWRWYARHP